MNAALRLAILVSAGLHLTASAALARAGQPSHDQPLPAIAGGTSPDALSPADHHAGETNSRPRSKRSGVADARLPLDVVLVKRRLYEPPTMLDFAVVTPFDIDNREAGVELRCNAQAIASATWTLGHNSDSVREFRWALPDRGCLYEIVAVLVRAKEYLYLYEMVPSRSWLPFRAVTRQQGRTPLRRQSLEVSSRRLQCRRTFSGPGKGRPSS
jgi:hypothetical protein